MGRAVKARPDWLCPIALSVPIAKSSGGPNFDPRLNFAIGAGDDEAQVLARGAEGGDRSPRSDGVYEVRLGKSAVKAIKDLEKKLRSQVLAEIVVLDRLVAAERGYGHEVAPTPRRCSIERAAPTPP